MTLQSELAAFKASWANRAGAEVSKLVADDIEALRPLAANALKAGDVFPAVVLADQLGRTIDTGILADGQALVVVFYRGGWCPYCNLDLRAYQQNLAEIEALGAKLVAVSPEAPDNTLSTAEKNDLSFPVLSDTKGRLADALGIRFELAPQIKALYQKFGHDLPARNADDRWSLPMPATYVVDEGGVIALAHVDPDYRTRLEPAAAITTLHALRLRRAA